MSSSVIIDLSFIQNQFTRYMSFVLLVSGTIGNFLNCLIFTRSSLRTKSCSIYFLATSIANLVALYFSCLTRSLITFDIYTAPNQGFIYCKARTFLTYMPLSASSWFIVAACVDRYASSSTSVRIRSFSQVKVSQRTICGVFIILCFIWVQMFVCFNGNSEGTTCSPVSQFCNTFNTYSLLIFYGLLPPMCMFLFGWMTIQHVRHRPINRAINIKDRQLTVMLIVQVLLFQILSLPISIQRIYALITTNESKSVNRIQIENFILQFVNYAAFTNTTTSFYMFTLTSPLFRKELKSLLFFSNRQRVNIAPIQITQQRIQRNTIPSRRQQQQAIKDA
ncbi:unnamed protein product [Adineta steineri]|uniref:G-protein coupled receptors family 1 profile domain-containing protein n=1 Tax=Adineta steineri TaxID=433720 RepID=A0A819KSW8_9BILA|nr:unnamed protein product [Adineta steineri]CAF3949980.1 unnamed protein product [Adineta steineri]